MNQRQFNRYLSRDNGCIHCGEVEAAVPHHRVNRGMGGSKLLDRPSNIIVLCSYINGLLESDAKWAERARTLGWKLPSWQGMDTPVWYMTLGRWVELDDKYGYSILGGGRVAEDGLPAF